jgi:hypothetical protein
MYLAGRVSVINIRCSRSVALVTDIRMHWIRCCAMCGGLARSCVRLRCIPSRLRTYANQLQSIIGNLAYISSYVHIPTYVRTYVRMCVHTYIYVRTHVRTYVHLRICTYVSMSLSGQYSYTPCTYVRTYARTCVYTRSGPGPGGLVFYLGAVRMVGAGGERWHGLYERNATCVLSG